MNNPGRKWMTNTASGELGQVYHACEPRNNPLLPHLLLKRCSSLLVPLSPSLRPFAISLFSPRLRPFSELWLFLQALSPNLHLSTRNPFLHPWSYSEFTGIMENKSWVCFGHQLMQWFLNKVQEASGFLSGEAMEYVHVCEIASTHRSKYIVPRYPQGIHSRTCKDTRILICLHP